MELGEPDESGRLRPIPIEGSKFNMKDSFPHLQHLLPEKGQIGFRKGVADA